jgi:Uma2 family endonuclease
VCHKRNSTNVTPAGFDGKERRETFCRFVATTEAQWYHGEMSEAARQLTNWISFAEYLEEEGNAEERHEYIDGKVFQMAGASERHEIVAGNLFVAIHQHLKGSQCRVFKGDMKVKVSLHRRDLVYYPDVMVTCDPADSQPLYKESPKLLIEVMSDYKADHVEKLFAYQQLPSLEQYLVVSQDPNEKQAWLYQRANDWDQEEGAPNGTIQLDSIDFSIALDEVYES